VFVIVVEVDADAVRSPAKQAQEYIAGGGVIPIQTDG
jgi:hypothetical protein